MNRDNAQQCTPQSVCEDLLKLLSVYKSVMIKIAEDHGLTIVQLHALRCITDGNTAMGKIAQVLHCDASNVTGIIDRLIALQLVTRQEDPQDRRVKSVNLTAKGEKILEQAQRDIPERLGCTKLTQAELASIHDAVYKLTTA